MKKMKRTSALALALLLLGCPVEAQSPAPAADRASESASEAVEDRPIKDKWALVIGVDRFEDPTIPALQFSAKDARDFADFLVTKGNFQKDHVLLLINEQATDDNIKKALGDDWLPRRVLPDDLVVIYASSHGSPKEIDVAQDNFLIAYNTHRDSLFATGLRLGDLANTVKHRTGCDRIVLLLDACNSGAAEAGGKGLYRPANFKLENEVGEGQIILSSSTADQRSWESKRYRNGVFTRQLMEALQAEGPLTSLPSAYEDLKDKVQQEVRFDRKADQVPLMKSRWRGKPVSLLAPPAKPRAAEPYHMVSSKTPVVAMVPSTLTRTAPASGPASGDAIDTIDKPSLYMERALELVRLRSFEEAFLWYRRAGELGVAAAQGQVGAMYVNGIGVDQNLEEGLKWLEKGAAAGDSDAQGQLGILYLRGTGVGKDYARAFELINQASEKGNARAQYLLGCMFARGLGVQKSSTLAAHWLKKASQGGIDQADRMLESMRGGSQ
ncbi:MAG: SEL1-like repeat protein [Candidatus Melainabacteria bacterium]|nr:SEL1-like repeat protein [Candidatus Melainabacteria bacterium]